MRKLFFYFIFFCFATLHAQRIIHPSLLFTEEQIQHVKEMIKQDADKMRAWEQIKQDADEQLQKGNLEHSDYLALVYYMTRDKKYANKLKELLMDAIKNKIGSSKEMQERFPVWHSDLGLAHKSYACAIAYDAIYKDLTSSERKTIALGLKDLALVPAIGDWVIEPTRIHSLNSMGHNWWTSCVCMGGILALSLQNELPEAKEWAEDVNEILPQWFGFAGDILQHKAKSFDDAGGLYESVGYASYGIQQALRFRLAWKNTHPGQKMEEISQLNMIPNYFVHVCYPRTGNLYSVNFGDCHKTTNGESAMLLLYALGYRNENILWYLNQVEAGNKNNPSLETPVGFLYRPNTDYASSISKVEKSQLFADFGWATLRDSWQKDATMLAVKSGQTWNHSHADANSLILFHKGVDIICDGGNCYYPNPEYRNYFFQSQAHNVVLFNGQGQSREQQYHGSPLRGYLHYLMDAGNIKYVLADGTGPLSDNFSRNFRHFLWIDNVIYVIDDLKTHKNGHFEWLWHPGGTVKKDGGDLNITNGQSSVIIRPLYPRALANSDFVHDYPDDLYWEVNKAPTENLKGETTYYSLHLPAEIDRVKGLTAIILKNSPQDNDLPQMEKREGKDWIGLRVHNKGIVTDLYINQLADGRLMHSNSWINADGWVTDAYMMAVSYKEGTSPNKSKTLFICYGSALRYGDISYFSSLSKLNVIQREGNDKLLLWMNGQPQMYATFRTDKKSVEVNGKAVNVIRTKSCIKVISKDNSK